MVIEVNRSGYNRIFKGPLSGKSGRSKRKSSIVRKKDNNNGYAIDFFTISLYRTKRILRRIILNQDLSRTSFLTLTFKENLTDLKKAKYEFEKFLKRLNYHLYKTKKSMIKYIAVPEQQQRGAWHFHILLFDVPYIPNDDIARIWQNGFIKINQVKFQNILEVYKYITKYLTKQFSENQKYLKRFLSSQGFFKGYKINVWNMDSEEYEKECKYWFQNIYCQSDYMYVSSYNFEIELNEKKYSSTIEFFYSKHFFDEFENLHRSRISDEFQVFRDG